MIPELELQQQLQRFASRFIERTTQCAEELQRSPSAEVRDEAMRKNLLYASSATEIATGPSAAVNLLDMFVFVHLSRKVLERHWIPTLYDQRGAELDEAFTRSEEELTEITLRAVGERGLAQLSNIVDAWVAENPHAVRVENIRLADFAAAAGTAAAERGLEARGLLSGMKFAAEAANQAMVIAERGLFLVHRLPFLWRLQVRLAVREILDDVFVRVKTGDEVANLARFARRGAYVALLGVASMGVLRLSSRRGRRR